MNLLKTICYSNLWYQRNYSSKLIVQQHLDSLDHLLKINIRYIYNYVIELIESLSFQYVKEVHERYLELFKNEHSFISIIYFYKDELYLSIENDQELLELLVDQDNNSDYSYVFRLFQEFYKNTLRDYNGKKMFECLI